MSTDDCATSFLKKNAERYFKKIKLLQRPGANLTQKSVNQNKKPGGKHEKLQTKFAQYIPPADGAEQKRHGTARG